MTIPINKPISHSQQLMERRLQDALQQIVRVLTPDLKDRMAARYNGNLLTTIYVQKGVASHVEVRHSIHFCPEPQVTLPDAIAVMRDVTKRLLDEFQTPARCVFSESYFGDVTLVIPMWQGRCGECYTEARQTHKVKVTI